MKPDYYSVVARKKLGAGEGWIWAGLEWLDSGEILVKGNVIDGVSKTGKKKWRKPLQKVIVTKQELEQAEKDYAAETGNCGKCGGTGEYVVWASVTEGVRKGQCEKCAGSGKAVKGGVE